MAKNWRAHQWGDTVHSLPTNHFLFCIFSILNFLDIISHTQKICKTSVENSHITFTRLTNCSYLTPLLSPLPYEFSKSNENKFQILYPSIPKCFNVFPKHKNILSHTFSSRSGNLAVIYKVHIQMVSNCLHNFLTLSSYFMIQSRIMNCIYLSSDFYPSWIQVSQLFCFLKLEILKNTGWLFYSLSFILLSSGLDSRVCILAEILQKSVLCGNVNVGNSVKVVLKFLQSKDATSHIAIKIWEERPWHYVHILFFIDASLLVLASTDDFLPFLLNH